MEIELIDLVTVHLQEKMNIPHWPKDSRFYALGNDRSFIVDYGQIKIYDKKNEKVITLSFDGNITNMFVTSLCPSLDSFSKSVSVADPEFFHKLEEFILFGI